MKPAYLCLFALMSSCPAGIAQTTEDLAARLQAMEERIRSLESEVQSLNAALLTAEQPPPSPRQSPAVGQIPLPAALPLQTTSAATASTDPTASARLMNPAASVIGNLIGSAGRNATVGGNALDPGPSLELTESEVSLSAAVDPYARADFFFSFGEEGVEVEEGYLTFPSLPGGFLLKAGKMRAQFGKVNTFHRHNVPWVDRPLVTQYLLGGEEGISDAGFSLSRLLPAPGGIFLEATGEVYRGDAEGVFESAKRSDVATVAHLRGFGDLSEATNVEMGLSYARGHNGIARRAEAAAGSLVTNIYGLDATFRWKPLRRASHRSFIARTELLWSQRRELDGPRKAFGYYAWGEYQFRKKWFTGVRFDRSERMEARGIRDTGVSAILTYWPSEFSQIRAQYRFGDYFEDFQSNELLFQFQYSIGAHGAHPF